MIRHQAIILDTEATSNDPKTSKVIELAKFPVDCSPFTYAKNPLPFLDMTPSRWPEGRLFGTDEPIKFGAMAAHNILPSDIEGLPHFGPDAAQIDAEYVIGHNVDFDAELIGLDREVRRICTLALARSLWPEADAHNQSALIYYMASKDGCLKWARDRLENAHRAVDDVENCALLLQRLLIDAIGSGLLKEDSWQAVWLISEDCRVPTRMTFGKYKGEPISNIPMSYARWYAGTEDTDPYVLKAFRKHGLLR